MVVQLTVEMGTQGVNMKGVFGPNGTRFAVANTELEFLNNLWGLGTG
jgi:hypothetical protein